MCKGGGGTNTVTQQSQPPPQFMAAYTAANQNAYNVAQTPYQPYTGQQVAPLNAEQLTGIQGGDGVGGINNASQIAAPYLGAAQNAINASTTPLLPGLQPYLNGAQWWDTQAGSTPVGSAASLYINEANQGYQDATSVQFGSIVNPSIVNANSLFGQAASTNFGNAVNPSIAAANGIYGQAGNGINFNPVTAGQIGYYESPYTQQVVGATQAEFNNENQQQMQGVRGNAISQGAFGGDREAVAEGITAGQEQLAQAPVIAGLENQGYSQALQEANVQQQQMQAQEIAKQQAQLAGAQGFISTGQLGLGATQAGEQAQMAGGQGMLASGQLGLSSQQAQAQALLAASQGMAGLGGLNLSQNQAQAQLGLQTGQAIAGLGQTALGANEANAWLNSQAGFGLANLGNEAFGQQMQQGNAMLGAGGLEQQVQQENLNVPYDQYIAQQAYPFQTAGWLASIAEGLGGASGGSSSTTSPGPSPFSQAAGLGITGLALNGMGAFNGIGSGLSSIGSGIGSLFGLGAAGAADYAGSFGAAGGGGAILDTLGGALLASRGRGIPEHRATGGIVSFPQHLARMPGTGNRGITANDNTFHMPTPHVPRMRFASGGGTDDAFADADFEGPGGITGNGPMDLTPNDELPVPPIPPPSHHGGITSRARSNTDYGGIPTPPVPLQQDSNNVGITARNHPQSLPADTGEPQHSPWQTLLAAGLGIMGGTSPHALTNIGRGGLQGLEFGEQQRVREEQAALRKLQQQDLAAYREGQLQNTANRNDIYGQRVQEQTAKDQAYAALEMARAANVGARHASEGDILSGAVNSLVGTTNPDTGQPWTRADAFMHVKGVDSMNARRAALTDQGAERVAQGGERIAQGDRRLDQGDQRLTQSQEAMQLRDDAVRRGQDMNSANADVRSAAGMVSAGVSPNMGAAMAQIRASRGQGQGGRPSTLPPAQQDSGSAVAAAPPSETDPLGIR